MARQKLDKETRKAISDVRRKVEDLARKDGNEDETRIRVYYVFETLLGY